MTRPVSGRGVENDTRVIARRALRTRKSRHVDFGPGAELGGRRNRHRTASRASPGAPRRRGVRLGSGAADNHAGRLVLISALLVVGAVCFGVIATGAEQSRERAVRAARTGTEPLLVHAVNLYTALSDANATVATGLLAGGLEPPIKRARYLHDLRVASESLTALTREGGTSATPRWRSGPSPTSFRSTAASWSRPRQQPSGLPDRRRLPAPGRRRCSRAASCPRPAGCMPPRPVA